MDTSIDDILNEPAAETPAPAVVETQEAATETPEPETIGQPRDESGRFAPKDEKGVETQETAQSEPPSEQNQLPPAEYAALKDERRKRQEAEARIAALEREFEAAKQKQPVQEQQVPEFWDNPDANINVRLEQFGDKLIQRFQQQQLTERVDASELVARSKYTDFDEKLAAFQQAVQFNPVLAKQMAHAPDPAEFAYNRGKTVLDVERVGSVDELLKAERAKWEAEARAAIPAPSLPNSTASERSVGARSGPAWAGATPIDSILSG